VSVAIGRDESQEQAGIKNMKKRQVAITRDRSSHIKMGSMIEQITAKTKRNTSTKSRGHGARAKKGNLRETPRLQHLITSEREKIELIGST